MRNRSLILIQVALVLTLFILLAVYLWLVVKTPIGTDLFIESVVTILVVLFPASAALLILLYRSASDRSKMHSLLRTRPGNTLLIFTANMFVPSGNAYTFNGRLRFGGRVIALQEYFAAHEISSFLEQDVLASYPTFVRDLIKKVIPEMQPFRALLRVSPMDVHRLTGVAEEYGLEKPASIVSLGSPGSNWLTAYVSEYYPGWLKFGTDGDYIKVDSGAIKGTTYTLDKYRDLGIIQRVSLPDENMTVVILAGLTDLSTRMCATHLVREWRGIASKYENGEDFGICLAVPLGEPEAYDRPQVISTHPERSR